MRTTENSMKTNVQCKITAHKSPEVFIQPHVIFCMIILEQRWKPLRTYENHQEPRKPLGTPWKTNDQCNHLSGTINHPGPHNHCPHTIYLTLCRECSIDFETTIQYNVMYIESVHARCLWTSWVWVKALKFYIASRSNNRTCISWQT